MVKRHEREERRYGREDQRENEAAPQKREEAAVAAQDAIAVGGLGREGSGLRRKAEVLLARPSVLGRTAHVEPCHQHRDRGEERAYDVERNHGREPPERVDHRSDRRAEDVAARLDGLHHAREAREVLGRGHERRERLEGGRVQRAADGPHEERDHDHPHGERARERDRRHDGAHRGDEEVGPDERDPERQAVHDGPREGAEERERQKARE